MRINVTGQWEVDVTIAQLLDEVRACCDLVQAIDPDSPGPHYATSTLAVNGGTFLTTLQITREGAHLEQRLHALPPREGCGTITADRQMERDVR